MSDGVAIAIGVGAVLVALYVTTQQEQQTAMRAASITAAKQNSFLNTGDVFAGGAAILAGIYGGPGAANTTLAVSGRRL